jgi:hypothetical protein
MSETERIEELLTERQWFKGIISNQQEQIANLMLLISQANLTAQQLSSTIQSLNSPPTPLTLTEEQAVASYDDDTDYSDYEELISFEPVEEPEYDTGLDEDDLALLGIELPK